jgi:hypothetical protein
MRVFVFLIAVISNCNALMVGVNFSPFTEEEWSFLDWMPMWRVEIDQAADVTRRGKTTLLLAHAENDSSVTDLMPFLNGSWGIELGNEPDINGHSTSNMNSWYLRMYQKLRSAGYTGNIVTGGVSSLSKKATKWLKQSIVGLPQDMIIGWFVLYSVICSFLPTFCFAITGTVTAMLSTLWVSCRVSLEAVAMQ